MGPTRLPASKLQIWRDGCCFRLVQLRTIFFRSVFPTLGALFSRLSIYHRESTTSATIDPVPFADYLRVFSEAIEASKPFHLLGLLGKWVCGDLWKYFSRSQRLSNARLKAVSHWKPTIRSVREGWPQVAAELARCKGELKSGRPMTA